MPQIKRKRQRVPNWQPLEANRVKGKWGVATNWQPLEWNRVIQSDFLLNLELFKVGLINYVLDTTQ